MEQKKDRKFVNGVFVKRVWVDSKDSRNELFGFGIKKRDFIQNIERIQEDEKGFINLTLGSQKEDHDKLSLWEKDEQANTSRTTSTSQTTTSASATPPADDDDLPF